jgi:hypothetical protein
MQLVSSSAGLGGGYSGHRAERHASVLCADLELINPSACTPTPRPQSKSWQVFVKDNMFGFAAGHI